MPICPGTLRFSSPQLLPSLVLIPMALAAHEICFEETLRLTGKNAALLQNILRIITRLALDSLGPEHVGHALLCRQHAPVGAVLRFQPLEVVDLVPLVLGGVLSSG